MLLENSEVFQDLSKNRADRVTQPRGADLSALSSFFPWVMELVRAVEAKLREEEMR